MQNQQNNIPPQPHYHEEDEIDLMELIFTLWKRKIFIILFTLIPTLLLGAYFYLNDSPSYKVTSYLNNPGRVVINQESFRTNQENLKGNQESFTPKGKLSIKYKDGIYLNQYNLLKNILNSNKFKKQLNKNLSKNKNLKNLANEIKLSSSPRIEKFKNISKNEGKAYTTINQLKITRNYSDEKLGGKANNLIIKTLLSNYINHTLSDKISKLLNITKNKISEYKVSKLSLKNELSSLEKRLKKLKSINKNKDQKQEQSISSSMLRFNLNNNSNYLPINEQIEMLNSKIVKYESQLDTYQNKIQNYRSLEKQLTQLSKKDKDVTLAKLNKKIENSESSFAKIILNRLGTNISALKDNFSEIRTSITKKESKLKLKLAITLIIFFIISILIAFLLEGIKNYKATHNENSSRK